MRKIMTLSVLTAAIAVAGCRDGPSRGSEVMTVDLERDLALASAPRVNRSAVLSAIEGGPTGAPSGIERGQRAPVAVRKRTLRPSPSPVEQEVVGSQTAAELPAPVFTATVSETVPAPSPAPEPVATAPAHDPITDNLPGSGPSAGNGDDGNSGIGRGSGGRRGGGMGGMGGIGGIIGVIIRGGGVGVDKCDPRTDGRGGRGGMGGVFGGRGGIGGMGGGIIVPISGGGDNRMPVGRPSYPRY